MATKRPARAGITVEDLDTLERQLAQNLNPVEPRSEFVLHLQRHLTTPATIIMESTPRSTTAFLVFGLGLFAGALLIWVLRRLR